MKQIIFTLLVFTFLFSESAWCQEIATAKVKTRTRMEKGADRDTLKVNEKVVPAVPMNNNSTQVFDTVEQMPSFKGGKIKRRVIDPETGLDRIVEEDIPSGDLGLMIYLSKTVKYPVTAMEDGIQGRVVCTFVVNTDGSITDVKVTKSVDPSLDKEAVRVIKNMPKWTPGMQEGQPIRVRYTVPVTFRLQ